MIVDAGLLNRKAHVIRERLDVAYSGTLLFSDGRTNDPAFGGSQ